MGLDEALGAVATQDDPFNAGGLTVIPESGERYETEPDYGTAYAGDFLGWTYAGGLDLEWGNAGHAREWSRVFEPFEYWDNAGHVRYNLPEAVEALERGRTVTFAYAVVTNGDLVWWEEQQTYVDDDGYKYDDNITGWCVLAYWED